MIPHTKRRMKNRIKKGRQHSVVGLMLLALSMTTSQALASPASDALLGNYSAAGGKDYSTSRGEALWKQEVTDHQGNKMACTRCHGTDLSQAGEHVKTHKAIKPMAASANAERYTDLKKIEKWFKRNCKDTWGRECTAQEKGDILVYLLAQ